MPATTTVGVIGCGQVSHMYLPVLGRMPGVEVAAVADVDQERARQVATKYDVPQATNPRSVLDNADVEVVVNLTPIAVHVEVSRAALTAGKHLWSEKPLAPTLDQARELLAAAEQRGLAVGCAPDTLLGSGFQAARAALADGAVGSPLSASGLMFRGAMGGASFYTEGATPILDMAPYYFSALVNLFGPAVRVSGAAHMLGAGEQPTRPPAGAAIATAAVVEFENGLLANTALVWGTDHPREVPVLTVYGSDGELAAPNPNNFGDPAYVRRYGEDWQEVPGSRQPADLPHNLRGLGVGELAAAVRAGRAPRAGGDIACHVVELITGLVHSARTGERVELTTTCTPAPPLPAEERAALLGQDSS
ncbi:Predicted dehydrogenase [Actinopolymorpha cephalotaxi]|uniref:Dehydrogenase n=1 Tax=Actinopolymorpha cephalotaxi TaxID=504797 RepID=A0A1I3AX11_9ACTN|nr:Gfo/Idh/MocA family oxidoreductase [Actinopolymorpha cephalotaxi]NYH84317.1 putative dehydrogenase [Actinopolymorpha cephalotaxi]SFH54490.1 Predicted dehydrogenase [Actinopolymorpha cephalotaxi]